MFKKRIRAWGIEKNMKEDEVVEAMQLKAARDAAGKPATEIVIRGRVVDLDRIWSYLERKLGLRHRRWDDAGSGPRTGASPHWKPSGNVVCRTPPPSPILRPAPELYRLEIALGSVRACLKAYATAPHGAILDPRLVQVPQTATPPDSDSASSSPAPIGVHDGPRMHHLLDEFTWLQTAMDIRRPVAAVVRILNARLDQLAAVVAKKATEGVEGDNARLGADSPECIFHLIETCQYNFAGYPMLEAVMYRHIGDLLRVSRGPNHPVSVVWGQLSEARRAGDRDLTRVLGRMTELLRDELLKSETEDELSATARRARDEDMAGFAMNNVIRLRFHDGHTLDSLGRLYAGWVADARARGYWREDSFWPTSMRCRVVMMGAEQRLALGADPWAVRADVDAVTQDPLYVRHLAHLPAVRAALARVRGRAAWHCGDLAAAEQLLRESLRDARSLHTRTDAEMEALHALRDVYAGAGRTDDAASTVLEIRALMARLGLASGDTDDALPHMTSPCRSLPLDKS